MKMNFLNVRVKKKKKKLFKKSLPLPSRYDIKILWTLRDMHRGCNTRTQPRFLHNEVESGSIKMFRQRVKLSKGHKAVIIAHCFIKGNIKRRVSALAVPPASDFG